MRKGEHMSLRYQHRLAAKNPDMVFIPYLESRARAWQNGRISSKKPDAQPYAIIRDALCVGVISAEMAQHEITQTWDDPYRALVRLICNQIGDTPGPVVALDVAQAQAEMLLAQAAARLIPLERKQDFESAL